MKLSFSPANDYAKSFNTKSRKSSQFHNKSQAWTEHSNDDKIDEGSSRPSSRASSTYSLYPGNKSQPKFLLLMLQHIRKEMSFLDVSDCKPGDPRRLQIYREAFGEFSKFNSFD